VKKLIPLYAVFIISIFSLWYLSASDKGTFKNLVKVGLTTRLLKPIKTFESRINQLATLGAAMLEQLVYRMKRMGIKEEGIDLVWFDRQIKEPNTVIKGYLFGMTPDIAKAKRYALKEFEDLANKHDAEVRKLVERMEDTLKEEAYLALQAKGIARRDIGDDLLASSMGFLMWNYITDSDKSVYLQKEISVLNRLYKEVISALDKLKAKVELPKTLTLDGLKQYQDTYKKQ